MRADQTSFCSSPREPDQRLRRLKPEPDQRTPGSHLKAPHCRNIPHNNPMNHHSLEEVDVSVNESHTIPHPISRPHTLRLHTPLKESKVQVNIGAAPYNRVRVNNMLSAVEGGPPQRGITRASRTCSRHEPCCQAQLLGAFNLREASLLRHSRAAVMSLVARPSLRCVRRTARDVMWPRHSLDSSSLQANEHRLTSRITFHTIHRCIACPGRSEK